MSHFIYLGEYSTGCICAPAPGGRAGSALAPHAPPPAAPAPSAPASSAPAPAPSAPAPAPSVPAPSAPAPSAPAPSAPPASDASGPSAAGADDSSMLLGVLWSMYAEQQSAELDMYYFAMMPQVPSF